MQTAWLSAGLAWTAMPRIFAVPMTSRRTPSDAMKRPYPPTLASRKAHCVLEDLPATSPGRPCPAHQCTLLLRQACLHSIWNVKLMLFQTCLAEFGTYGHLRCYGRHINVLILLDGGDSNLIIPNKLSMLAIPSTTAPLPQNLVEAARTPWQGCPEA